MDTERFIREQIRLMLQEKTDSKPTPKAQPKAEPKTSGKRMGKTANKGKQSEQVANISALAKSNPGQLFSNLKISPTSITGSSNKEKALKVANQAFNSPEFSLAFESVEVVGSEGEGWSVEFVVKTFELEDKDGEEKPIIPTGRAARYVGALFTAATNLGLVKFDPSDPQSVKHTPEALKAYVNLPV